MKALLTRFSIPFRSDGAVGLELVPGLAGPQRRRIFGRHVPHVHDRASGPAPRAQQLGRPSFQGRVVAPAPGRLVEADLEIDDQQRGRVPFEWEHAATVRARGPRTKTPMLPIGAADDKVER
jgi:hypothetical protein